MAFLDQRTTAVARTLAFYTLIGAFLYGARHTIVAFTFAIFFAYVIEPLVSKLQSLPKISRGSRSIAIAEVYLVLGLIFTGFALGAGPYLASEGRELVSAAPTLLDKLGSGQIVRQIGSSRGWSYETQVRLQQLLLQERGAILAWIRDVGIKVGAVAANVFWLVLIPILAVFFLKEGGRIADFVVRSLRVSQETKTWIRATLQDINDMTARYIRAQLMLAGMSIVVYTVFFTASRLQYGIILGVFAGMLDFIPIIGPLVATILVLSVAVLTGFHHILLLVLFFGAWRLVQDYINSPRLMQKNLRLHPLAVIFAVLSGGEIGGVVGVYLSIPIAATLQILWRRWTMYSESTELSNQNAPHPTPRAA